MSERMDSDTCQQCGMAITSVRACKSKRAGLCSKCFKRTYDKTYRQDHKERYKEYAQRYYQANRETLRERNTAQKRLWRSANRLHYREYQRDYKRRIRSHEEYPWGELPRACSGCGEDLSGRWGTRSRREGLCPRCYRRKVQSEYYRKVKHAKPRHASSGEKREPSAVIGESVPLNAVV